MQWYHQELQFAYLFNIYTQLSNMKVGNEPIYELVLLLIGICPADGLAPLGPKLSAKHIVEL